MNRMEDIAAAQAAVAHPKIFRRKNIEGELNFISDLDALEAAFEADNIVCRFENPINPEGNPIDFEMRPMTPGETAIYYGTLLGHTFFESAAGGIANDELDEFDDEQAKRLQDEQEERLQDELAVKKYDAKLLNVLESCIISHPRLTAERMRKWDPFYVISLHNALLTGSRPSKSVAQFPKVDTGTRK